MTWPTITPDPCGQACYERCRGDGMTHDEAFVRAARKLARRRVPIRPHEVGDTLSFHTSWEYPRISGDFDVQVRYWELRLEGQSHNMAEILATRSFPGTHGTDRAFMEGRHRDGSQFEGLPPIVGREYVRKALAAGVNPAGKYYSGPLAAFPGDPRAWVDGLDDVRRIARERGLEVRGAVDLAPDRPASPPPTGPYRVAEDIIGERVADAVAAEPALAPRRAELAADLATRLSGIHGA